MDANQKRKLRRLWAVGLTDEEICDETGLTQAELTAAVVALSLPERQEGEVYLPTRLEIVAECAKFRAGWSEAERDSRRRGMIGE